MMEPEKIKIITDALKGNQAAIEFALGIAFIARVWDNIIDKDRHVPDQDINRMMWVSLVEIPSNSFYVDHQFQLIPLVRDVINSWLDANEYEKSGDQEKKHVAYILRDLVGNIIIQCAYIIGGYDWMREVSPKIREIQFEEPLSKYMEGL